MVKTALNSHYILWGALALPAIDTLYRYRVDAISYGEALHNSGDWAVRLLIVTLAVTPARLAFANSRWPLWLVQRRRAFGVAMFGYALLHTLFYLARKQDLALILEEGEAWDILTSWIALAIFLFLALTSNNASLRALKRFWKILHRFVYPATALTFLHWVLTAFDATIAFLYAGIAVGLECFRLALMVRRARRGSVPT